MVKCLRHGCDIGICGCPRDGAMEPAHQAPTSSPSEQQHFSWENSYHAAIALCNSWERSYNDKCKFAVEMVEENAALRQKLNVAVEALKDIDHLGSMHVRGAAGEMQQRARATLKSLEASDLVGGREPPIKSK